jgi:hypothetical protein
MTESEYRGQATLLATVVPARAAYLVRKNSHDGFRRAVQEASTRWAGVTEPIVPVSANGRIEEWALRMVTLADVEGLVNVDLPDSEAESVSKRLGLTWVPLVQARWAAPLIWTCDPGSVGVPPVQGSSVVAAQNDAKLWMVVAAGTLSTEYVAAMHRLNFPLRSSSRPDDIGRAQLHDGTWLDRTTTSFGETFGSQIPLNYPAVLWFTKNDELQDCWAFWNVRALRPVSASSVPMLLLPTDEVQHRIEFDKQFAAILAPPDQFSPDVVLTSRTVSHEDLHKIAEVLYLQSSENTGVQPGGGYPIPGERRQSPFTYLIWNNPYQFVQFKRTYGISSQVEVHIFQDSTTIQFESPVVFRGGGSALLRISGTPFDGLPRRSNVASIIAKGATWHEEGIQLGVIALNNYRFELHVPTLPEALHTILNDISDSYAMSNKGSLADGLAQTVDINSLLRPGVFEMVQQLTSPRSTQFLKDLKRLTKNGDITQEAEKFARVWAGQGKRTYRSVSEATSNNDSEWSPAEVLEGLCALGWAERGLEIKCSRCRMSSFIHFADVPTRGPAICPACHAEQQYTSRNSKTFDRTIFYRLDGLVDTASDQGVLPHLLTIAALARLNPQSYFLPGVDFQFDGMLREADIVGLHGGKLLVGEVKTKGTEFNTNQLIKDIGIAKALEADTYVMAAPDAISANSIKEAKIMTAEARIDLLVLDRTDLRPSLPPAISIQ